MKKVIQRSVWLHWSAEKQNAEQAVVNVGRSEPNMQAVPLNKTKSECIYKKSDQCQSSIAVLIVGRRKLTLPQISMAFS